MSDRTDTRDSTARAEAAEAPIDEDLEEALEDTLDEASTDEAGELEEVVATFVDADEEQNEKIEAVLEIEDQTAINEGAVLDVLLRRSGVLPEQTDTGTLDEETELPAARRDGEFVCSSCFLIKPNSQMGDANRRVCRDCADPPRVKQVAHCDDDRSDTHRLGIVRPNGTLWIIDSIGFPTTGTEAPLSSDQLDAIASALDSVGADIDAREGAGSRHTTMLAT